MHAEETHEIEAPLRAAQMAVWNAEMNKRVALSEAQAWERKRQGDELLGMAKGQWRDALLLRLQWGGRRRRLAECREMAKDELHCARCGCCCGSSRRTSRDASSASNYATSGRSARVWPCRARAAPL